MNNPTIYQYNYCFDLGVMNFYIVQSNYRGSSAISLYDFPNKESAMETKSENDVCIWHVKVKEVHHV